MGVSKWHTLFLLQFCLVIVNSRIIFRDLIEKLMGSLEIIKTNDKGAAISNLAQFVSFHLYTRKNVYDPQELKEGDKESLSKSYFDPSKHTYVIVHGWKDDLADPSVQLPKNALLKKYDCNVIAVDWSKIASVFYPVSAGTVPRVGAYVAQMLKFMLASANLDLKRTNLIGHSLGAQVCGFAGKDLKGLGLARITGLDPALPIFYFGNRLEASDADFVDCIHTNGGIFGYLKPICGASFYANGGITQPGCNLTVKFCDHRRSFYLYTESISGGKFKAKQCQTLPILSGPLNCVPSEALMGEPADPSLRGIFYVKTRSMSPFAEDPQALES